MKKKYFNLKLNGLLQHAAVVIFLILHATISRAQLSASNSYTLDGSSAASMTNYTNLQSFFDDIALGSRSDGGPVQGPGVTGSGDIVLNIISSVVNEQIVILPHDSLNSSRRVVVKGNYPYFYYNPNPSAKYVLWLKGADYFVFDSLQIVNWNTLWSETVILSDGADYNIFRNCNITNDNFNYDKITINTNHTQDESVNRSNYSDAGAIVVFGNSVNSLKHNVRNANGKGNLFENNKIICVLDGNGRRGATYGIFELGDGTSNSGNNSFIRNKIINASGVAIYSYASGGGKYNNNTIVRTTNGPIQDDKDDTYYYGIQLYYPYLSAYPSQDIEIIGNTIQNIGDSSRTDNAHTFYGIAISRTEGNTSDMHSGYNGTNIIRVEDNKVVNNYSGNKYDNKANVYPFAAYLAQNVYLTNNVFSNNIAYPPISNPIREAKFVIDWYATTGDIINNTFYRSFDYTQYPGTVTVNDYFNISGSKSIPLYPTIPRQLQTIFSNNNSYFNVKASTANNNGPNFQYLYEIKNNNLYYNPTTSSNNAAIYSLNYLQGANNPQSLISVNNLNFLSGADSNINADPAFVNGGKNNLSFLNPALNSSGTFYKSFAYPNGITNDILGFTRDSSKPDIGAVEVDFDFLLMGDFNGGDYDICSESKPEFEGFIISKFNFDYTDAKIGYALNSHSIDFIEIDTVKANDTTFFKLPKFDLIGEPDNSILRVFISHYDDDNSNDTLVFNLNIRRGITSAVIAKSIHSKGLDPDSTRDYYVVIPGDSLSFDVDFPLSLTNYSVITYVLNSMMDTLLLSNYYPLPSSGNKGQWLISPTDFVIDSMLEARLVIHNDLTNCDSTISIKIFVSPYGKPDFLVSKACVSTEIFFENKSFVKSGTLSYDWDFGDGNTSKSYNPRHTYTSPGKYSVTLKTTTSVFGFEKSLTKVIHVNEYPEAKFSVDNACFGSQVNIQNKTIGKSDTTLYRWDFGNGQTSDTTSPLITYTSAGDYAIRLIASSESGCEDTFSKVLTLFPVPKTDFDFVSPICLGTPVGFTNKTTIAFSTWSSEWHFGTGEGKSLQNNPTYNFQSEGSKSVKLLVNTVNGCKDSIIKSILVGISPQISISTSDACINNPTLFKGNVVIPAGESASFKWKIDGKNYYDSTPIVTFGNVGLKTVNLQVTFSNGCSNNASMQIGAGHKPDAQFTMKDTLCTQTSFQPINKTIVNFGIAKYKWDMGDTVYNDVFVPNHIYKINLATNYNVMLVAFANNAVCSDTAYKKVRVGVTPICDFSINSIWIPGHRGYEFEAQDFDGEYTWDFGDGNSSDAKKPTHQFKEDGNYNVKLNIRTPEGCECSSSFSHTVTNLGISQTFSQNGLLIYPNPGTGIFKVEFKNGIQSGELKIYDSKGTAIFSSNVSELLKNDNFINLSAFAQGVYFVRVVTEEEVFTGKIELLR
ncbi:MAG: PKD domain-containing protein [Bacteroidetes bacterium]|nr:PKD domain-containing protein [Bacteroidota bacterium]